MSVAFRVLSLGTGLGDDCCSWGSHCTQTGEDWMSPCNQALGNSGKYLRLIGDTKTNNQWSFGRALPYRVTYGPQLFLFHITPSYSNKVCLSWKCVYERSKPSTLHPKIEQRTDVNMCVVSTQVLIVAYKVTQGYFAMSGNFSFYVCHLNSSGIGRPKLQLASMWQIKPSISRGSAWQLTRDDSFATPK